MNLRNALKTAMLSDTGRARSRNEDTIGEDLDIGVVVLADGMGGHQSGDVASALAVNAILRDLRLTIPAVSPGETDPATGYALQRLAVRQAIVRANQAIYTSADAYPHLHGMGTTLVMAIFYNDVITVANVGDSRLYRYRGNRLEQVTVDHTLRQELVDRGYCTPAEARASLNKNLITRALGTDVTVAIDLLDHAVLPGDLYLLCSDGLSDMLDDHEIQQAIERSPTNLEAIAERLVLMANHNGGRDNISVILVRACKSFPKKQAWQQRISGWI
ncbi:MAG: Stp1/IreP family PP2C-type Ser/Thr phosphatase [Gammaproteobacteria bacterium]|nr:Stp1/IreP family PP2C-type Ser/Thr phosphatase [Gammaproteobacteria bacterium]